MFYFVNFSLQLTLLVEVYGLVVFLLQVEDPPLPAQQLCQVLGLPLIEVQLIVPGYGLVYCFNGLVVFLQCNECCCLVVSN